MRLFSRAPKQEASVPTAGETQISQAREVIIGDVSARIREGRMTGDRQRQVEGLPGGRGMVAEAVRRAAQR